MIQHGTLYAYVRHRCRCAPCRVAYKRYRVRRARAKAAA